MTADIIHHTRTTPPALLPIFRSEHQLRLLGELFVRAGEARSLSELATATGVPQATVSREIERLHRAGLVTSSRRGRLRLVDANRQLPYFEELRSLLLKTVGPAAALREALAEIDSVDDAFIFGSWAARYEGETGPPPNDIDLLVVGNPDLDELYAALRAVERDLRLDVNPVVRSPAEWQDADAGFLDQVRRGPLVRVSPAPTS
jgi:DNA-binding transcriptional ArsR family regulator